MPSCPLSVLVITRNEERNIAACLESVAWATETIVVDAESADATQTIAQRFTDKVIVRAWQGFGNAKNFALTQCTQPWVLWLDADERVTPELASEIQTLLASNPPAAAYAFARRAFFLGKWIRHCGWYPGYVTRLFRRGSARFSERPVHEELIVTGNIERLHNDLLHYTDETLDHYLSKLTAYTALAAEEIKQNGGTASLSDLCLRPPLTFIRMYFIKAGFLDGMHGFVLCILSAFYVFVKYAKTWAMQSSNRAASKERSA